MPNIGYGLDISDNSIEAVALSKKKGVPTLELAARTEIPNGVVSHGVITDQAALIALLKKFFASLAGKDQARLDFGVTVADSLVFGRSFFLPATLDGELAAKAAAHEAAGTFPIMMDDVLSGSVLISKTKERQQIYYAVTERTVLESYRAAISKAGANVLFFEPEVFSQARAALPSDLKEPALLVDFGGKTTMIAVADQGNVCCSSSIPFGGDNLTTAIELKLNIPREKAEAMKRAGGFDPAKDEGRLLFIMQEATSELVHEIKRTVEYYYQAYGHRITAMYLGGGASLTPAISDYLSSDLPDLKISVMEPFGRLPLPPQVKNSPQMKVSVFYAAASGAAMRALGMPGFGQYFAYSTAKNGAASTAGKFFDRVRATAAALMPQGAAGAAKPKISRLKIIAGSVFLLISLIVVGRVLYDNYTRLTGPGEPSPAPTGVPAMESLTITIDGATTKPMGRLASAEATETKTFAATGQSSGVNSFASGKVDLVNKSTKPYTLAERTRLLSEGGVLFRTEVIVNVPAGKTVSVDVQADQNGSLGNIGPGKFTLPGLPVSQQRLLYATSSAPMTGGGSQTMITAADVTAAKVALTESLKSQANEAIKIDPVREKIVPGLVVLHEVKFATPDVGAPLAQFEATMTVQASTLVLPIDAIKTAMLADLRTRLPKDKLSNPFAFDNLTFVVVSFDPATMKAELRCEAQVREVL